MTFQRVFYAVDHPDGRPAHAPADEVALPRRDPADVRTWPQYRIVLGYRGVRPHRPGGVGRLEGTSLEVPWSCSGASRATSPRSSARSGSSARRCIAVDVVERLQAVPALPREVPVAERALPPRRPQSLRGLLGASRRQLRGARGRDGRDPGAQRLGEVDAAQVRVGDPAAHPGRRSSSGGSLAALLELGAGFQPELSGRDNIFLNASLLGLVDQGGGQALRRDRRLRRAGAVHRQPGEVLLVGHVRPARLRGGGQRRPRRPGGGRGAGRGRRELPAQVPGDASRSSRTTGGPSCSSPTPRTWSVRSATSRWC